MTGPIGDGLGKAHPQNQEAYIMTEEQKAMTVRVMFGAFAGMTLTPVFALALAVF